MSSPPSRVNALRTEDILSAAAIDAIGPAVASDEEQHWEVFRCESDPINPPFYIVCFQGCATWRSAERCAIALGTLSERLPVRVLMWPESVVARDKKRLAGMLMGDQVASGQCLDVTTFLARAADRTFQGGSLQSLTPRTFVEPTIRLPDNSEEKAFGFIERWLADEWPPADAAVLVLVAPAALGKTTLARAIRDRLAEPAQPLRLARRPLMLEASMWAQLNLQQASFDDIWVRAVANNYRGGLSVETLTAFVQAGNVLPIFDGFDELCSRAGDEFSPTRTISHLIHLADSERARVLVTTRDSYWNEVRGGLTEGTLRQIYEVHLCPFSPKDVTRFLERRFPGDAVKACRQEAQRLLDRIRGQTGGAAADGGRFEMLPLIVEVVCDAVEDLNERGSTSQGLVSTSPVNAAISLACSRERERRGLELDEAEQRALFRELAVYQLPRFTRAELVLTAQGLFERLSKTQCESVIPAHQLLYNDTKDEVCFRYEFVREFFRAETLVVALREPSTHRAAVTRLLSSDPTAQGIMFDQWMRLVGEDVTGLREAWRFMRGERKTHTHDRELRRAQSALLQLAIRIACRDRPVDAPERAAATVRVTQLLGDEPFTATHIVGPIANLGLQNVVLRDCLLENSGLRRCDIHNLRFAGCVFEGTFDIEACLGGGSIEWPTGAGVSLQAQAAFLAQRTSDAGITREQVLDMIHTMLSRFRRGPGLRSLKIEDVFQGPLCDSELAHDVWDALSGVIVEKHTISSVGPTAGRNIKPKLVPSVRQFLDNRHPCAELDEVATRVAKKWVR